MHGNFACSSYKHARFHKKLGTSHKNTCVLHSRVSSLNRAVPYVCLKETQSYNSRLITYQQLSSDGVCHYKRTSQYIHTYVHMCVHAYSILECKGFALDFSSSPPLIHSCPHNLTTFECLASVLVLETR